MKELTHLDKKGHAHMVDVGDKGVTARMARASARLRCSPEVIALIRGHQIEKGDVLAVARVAGIMATKRTADLIPLCHPLPITGVVLDLELEPEAVAIRAEVRCSGQTGVEMEALTAASVAALTVYDMCKAVDRAMVIEYIRLDEKAGGRSGHYRREET